MRNRLLPIVFVLLFIAVLVAAVIYNRNRSEPSPNLNPAPSNSPLAPELSSPSPSALPGSPLPLPSSNPHPDLSVDESGLSKAMVILNTSRGTINFKFYPQEAPKTVHRIVELINQGFYNGLTWHRVKPGFIVQAGDPTGKGEGGSGQKLEAEFNNRRHVEGAVAMARLPSDPNSADSQFYISLGTFPHLDHSYTVFGQVISGIDVARRIQVGDKIISMIVQ